MSFSGPRWENITLREELEAAFSRVLSSGNYILGSEVGQFELEFAAATGAKHAISVASGTDAVRLALMALDIGAGDEVITVAHTAIATISAIVQTGARPVLCDIDARTMLMDTQLLPKLITPRTRAILPVHLYGALADMAAVRAVAAAAREDKPIDVIEDCAQAFGGSPIGTTGTMGCFSFYPTKNLAALGDGGAIVTNDSGLAHRLRCQRFYGNTERDNYPQWWGINSRLDELQAAFLRAKLKYVSTWTEQRRNLAMHYTEKLNKSFYQCPTANAHHEFHQYVVRCQKRDALLVWMKERGWPLGVHYPRAAHQHAGYQPLVSAPLPMTQTDRAVSEIVSLPMHPGLSIGQADEVVTLLNAFAAST
jgi:dTDP-4-amino-4,6-dideoxygalactose transaminase